MNAQLKNIMIGLFVITGALIIAGIILFIKPSVGDGKQVLKVRFSNISGINVGTPVAFAGRTIGEVEKIQQISGSRELSVSEFGLVYPFLLTLHIDSSITVFSNDEVSISTFGLLGEKYILITPRPQKPNKHYHIITEKDIVYADSTDLFESAVNEFGSLAEKVEETLDKVILWMDKYGDEVGATVASFHRVADGIAETVDTINKEKLVVELKNSFSSFGDVFAQVDYMISCLREANFTENLAATMSNFQNITTSISNGKGTIGKLIEEDGLYLAVSQVMNKANVLMDDVNSYGLLFSYNKAWQRERMRRMTQANALSNPVAFQMQMDQDVDSMVVTLSRMNDLTSKFSTSDLAHNRDFKRQFAYLMQRLNALQDQVKTYNQVLYEAGQNGSKCKNE